MASVAQDTYQSKLISQKDFISRLRPGNYLHFGVWYGQAYGVIRALAEHGQALDPLYISNAYATGAWGYFDAPGVACVTSFFGPFERQAQRGHDNVFYIPMQYTDGQRLIREGAPFDYYVFRAAPMDERGYFNCSLTSSWEYGAIRHIHESGLATKVVIEVNARLPRVHGLPEFGNNELHVSYADIIVEDDSPLLEFPTPPPTEIEQAIARNVAQLVRNGDTLQLGFGGIPMAIGRLLKDRRELGIHSEMLCEAHLDLIESGSVTNAHKGLYDGLSVCTFALGERRMHDWTRENPALAMLPVEEINSMRVLSRVRRMASVNSILTIDLTGQACAHCLGPTTYSGLGGAFEFAYGAQLSPGGRSILCLPSQARLKDGSEVSNVVARHPPGVRVTVPEHCTDWVVTEYGAARLKFLNLEQRAAALIEIAHPKYREDLSRQAVANGLRITRIKGMPIPSEHLLRSAD